MTTQPPSARSPSAAGADPIAARWRAALLVALAANALLGAVLVLAPSVTRAGFGWMLHGDPGHLDGFDVPAQRYVDLLHAVLGSVLVGWTLLMVAVVRGPLARGEPWALPALGWSWVAWFVPDTAVSLISGHAPNAVLNTAFAIALGVPWLALWRRRPPAVHG